MQKLDNRGSIAVDIYNLDGSLEFKAHSANECSKFLQMSDSSVPLYLNNAKPYFIPSLDKFLTLRSPGFQGDIVLRKLNHVFKNASPLVLPNYKLEELSPLFLYCFDEYKHNFNTFFTLTLAYARLFPTNYTKF